MSNIEDIRSDIKSVDAKVAEIVRIISPDELPTQAPNVATINLEGVRADLKSISEKISELTKTIALSTLAMSWLLLIGGKDSPSLPQAPDKILLVFTIIVSVLSLVTAYLQYVFAYASSKIVHDLAEDDQKSTTSYDQNSALHKLRKCMFWIKQAFAGLAVMLFFAVLLMALV